MTLRAADSAFLPHSPNHRVHVVPAHTSLRGKFQEESTPLVPLVLFGEWGPRRLVQDCILHLIMLFGGV